MTDRPITIAIIIGSNREGRRAPLVAQWFGKHVHQRRDIEADVIDLAEVQLPFSMPQSDDGATAQFARRLSAADAFVVITPEYNHGYPAVLKNAIDSALTEWRAKPVGFVAYGGISGGLRAVEALRVVFGALRAVTISETVSLHGVNRLFDDSGVLRDSSRTDRAAQALLDELTWWARALRSARHEMPYPQVA